MLCTPSLLTNGNIIRLMGTWRIKTNEELDNLIKTKLKLHGLSPRANYTDRVTAVCRQSDCQLLPIEGATWSARRIPTAVFSVF
jgi:hypothetical protein